MAAAGSSTRVPLFVLRGGPFAVFQGRYEAAGHLMPGRIEIGEGEMTGTADNEEWSTKTNLVGLMCPLATGIDLEGPTTVIVSVADDLKPNVLANLEATAHGVFQGFENGPNEITIRFAPECHLIDVLAFTSQVCSIISATEHLREFEARRAQILEAAGIHVAEV